MTFHEEQSPSKRRKKSAVVQQQVLVTTTPVSDTKQTASPPKSPKKPKTNSDPEPDGSKDPPKDWESIYSLVEELRKDYSAPVDDNGSEALPQRDRGDEVFRFQVLIALMLSSQTKDAVVGETMRDLQKHGLDIETISETSDERLNELIRKVGFHNNKTKYIKQTVEILKNEYNGDIPQIPEELMKLPGVGPKMAYIFENVAWGRTSGIGIDTHMHRMFNDLKWVNSKTPEQTRIQLEAWLPREKWPTVNLLWVGFGQEVQQFKPKLLRKALDCSRPREALYLIKKLGLDYRKEGAKLGLEDQIRDVLNS
jgi:endonuclease-3